MKVVHKAQVGVGGREPSAKVGRWTALQSRVPNYTTKLIAPEVATMPEL